MHPVRIVLAVSFAASFIVPAPSQESSASRPAAETRPESGPAEVRARHPRIGIRCEALALEKQHVARVEEVKPGSPADKAGIKIGDVIAKIGGEEVRDDKTYRDLLSRRRPGESVSFTIRRGGEEMPVDVTLVEKLARTEPEAVTVQHILIKCSDKPAQGQREKPRAVEDARKLAEEILRRAKNGADFDELVKSYSEDVGSVKNNPPGSYSMVQDGKPTPTPDIREFSKMMLGFSAVSFALEVGDVAIAAFDPDLSSYGFHVIKRIR